MTPVPNKPMVIILLGENNEIIRTSNNIDAELDVIVTKDQNTFNKKSFRFPYARNISYFQDELTKKKYNYVWLGQLAIQENKTNLEVAINRQS